MTKHTYTSNHPRNKVPSRLGRAEHDHEDERPLAEVRKNLHSVLRILAQHRWSFFLPFTIVASTVFTLSLYYPRTYLTSTTFELKNDPVLINLPLSSGPASFEQYRDTRERDLTSLRNMREVVENLGLTKDFDRNENGELTRAAQSQRDGLARSLASNLSLSTFSPNEHLDITTVKYTGPDPKLGRRVVAEATRVFITKTKAWIYDFLTEQRAFWAKEAEAAGLEHKLARRRETEFLLENPHADPNNPGSISLRLAQGEMERRELLLRKREYDSELSALQQMLAAITPFQFADVSSHDDEFPPPPGEMASPGALRLLEKIYELDRRIDNLVRSRGMTTEHPEVVALLDSRGRVEEQLHAQRVTDGEKDVPMEIPPGIVLPELSTPGLIPEIPSGNERGRLLVQIAAQKTKLTDVEISLETNEATLERDREAKRVVYDKQEEFSEIQAKVMAARKKLASREKTVASIDPAINAFNKNKLLLFSDGNGVRGGTRPISPKAMTVVVLALLAGGVAGALFVILAEIFDQVYRSSAQVARSLGLPMLESIDEIVTSEDRRFLFLRKMVVTPIVVFAFVGLVGIAGSMAYLSIEQPDTYVKLSRVPRAVFHLFAAAQDDNGG